MISVALERPCGFLNRHEQFPTVLDISSSRDLYFLTMVGGVNRRNEADSATTSEKQTLIFAITVNIRGFQQQNTDNYCPSLKNHRKFLTSAFFI